MALAAPARGADLVVQDREEQSDHRVNPDASAPHPHGIELLAHRYETTNFSTTRKTRLVLAAKPTVDIWHTITILDLDRDGVADVQVFVTNQPQGYYSPHYLLTWPKSEVVAVMQRLPAANTYTRDGRRCFRPASPARLINDPLFIAKSEQPVSDLPAGRKRVELDLEWPPANEFGELPAYAPIMTTVALDGFGHPQAFDELPNSAGSHAATLADTRCEPPAGGSASGLILDPARGSDRGFLPETVRETQAFPDRTGDAGDVRAAAVDGWHVWREVGDATLLQPRAQNLFRPADLVLRLPASGDVTVGGILAPPYHKTHPAQPPIGVLNVSLEEDADEATVKLWHRFGAQSSDVIDSLGASGLACYATSGSSSMLLIEVTLPVFRQADGTRVVRVVLDAALGEQDITHERQIRPGFRWVVFGVEGVERDYVPDTAGQTAEGVRLGSCAFNNVINNGTTLHPFRIPLFERPLTTRGSLEAFPASVPRGGTVALSANYVTEYPALSFSFDTGGNVFRPAQQPSITARFDGSYTARVAVEDSRGVLAISERHVRVDNAPPKASIMINGQPPTQEYGLAAGGTTLRFSGLASTDDGGITSYAWRLTPAGGGEPLTGSGPVFEHRFSEPGSWTVTLTVTDGDEATDTTSVTFRISEAVPPPPARDKPPIMKLAGPASVSLGPDGRATATFDAGGSAGANDDPTLTFRWDLDGNGSYEVDTGSDPRATTVYTRRGARTVRVLGIDRYGNSAVAAHEILVRDPILDADCPGAAIVRTVKYGPVRATGCVRRIERENAGPLWIASGQVNLNGLILTGARGSTAVKREFPDCTADPCRAAMDDFNDPRQGVAIALDTWDGKLVSNAPIAITATSTDINLPLSLAPLDVTLPFAPQKDGFVVRVPQGVTLLGMPVKGEAEVRFPADGETSVKLWVTGPEFVLPMGGAALVRATSDRGVILDQLKVDFNTGLIGSKIVVKQLVFQYDRNAKLWLGSGLLAIPTQKGFDVAFSTSIQDGRFKSLSGGVAGINKLIGKGIYLQGIRFSVAVNPIDLSGGMTLSIGSKIPGLGRTVVSADADFRASFPTDARPFHVFALTGKVKLLDYFQLADALVQMADNGATEIRGGIGGDYIIGYFSGVVGGWVSDDVANLTGDVEAGLLINDRRVALAGAHAVVSTKGVAACGTIPIINLGGGLGFKWGGRGAQFAGCDLSRYSEARPAALSGMAARAAQTPSAPVVRVAPDTPAIALSVEGHGGAPAVRLVDAAGQSVVDAAQEILTPTLFVQRDEEADITTILWKQPPAGRYHVVALPGSPRVTRVSHAEPRAAQTVRATVNGSGHRRTLRWRVTPQLAPDQQLTLAEQSPAGSRSLLLSRKSAGSTSFTPTPGSGTRTIVASIQSELAGNRPATVARFSPPRVVRPAKPRGLVLRRSGRRVVARFQRPHATRIVGYDVAARIGSNLIQRRLTARARSFILSDVPRGLKVHVDVRGLTVGYLTGDPARATLTAGALRSDRRRATDARPRAVRILRRGRDMRVTWRRGAEPVREFIVIIRGRGRTIELSAHPQRSVVRLARAPRGRVHVVVRAVRFGGAPPVEARARG